MQNLLGEDLAMLSHTGNLHLDKTFSLLNM